MNTVAIEDEGMLLAALESSIRYAEPRAHIECFASAEEALAWDGINDTQVAFVDVRLPGMDGLAAAGELVARNPRMNIIFVTGYSEYAHEALMLHASGYILKPVTKQKVRQELDTLRYPVAARQLHVQCFGNFEIYVDDEPFVCRNRHAMELLAYLVDRRGVRCSVGEVGAVILGERSTTTALKSHMRNVIADLTRALRDAEVEDALVRQRGYIGLNRRLVSCDYWDYLEDKPGAGRTFRGEYMSQYSWAETTLANLLRYR